MNLTKKHDAALRGLVERYLAADVNARIIREELQAVERQLETAARAILDSWPTDEPCLQVPAGILQRGTKSSVSIRPSIEDRELVEFALAHALKTQPARPETVAAATISAAHRRGIDVSAVADVSTTQLILATHTG